MTLSLKFDGGLTCSLKVKDLDAAIKWYEDRLGLRTLYKVDEMGWCEMASPVARVSVGLSQTEESGGPGNAILTWGVQDIDHARGQLETKGVRFDGPTQTIPGMVRLATFFDPDGNAMMFYQDLQQQK